MDEGLCVFPALFEKDGKMTACSSTAPASLVPGSEATDRPRFQENLMLGSRLFHTVVLVGAALVAGAGIGCSGDDGAPSPSTGSTTGTETSSNDPGSDGGARAADSGADAGWAPTK
jgi:hypothetical protein